MNDKDWLNRVTVAYKIYKEQLGSNPTIEEFIEWLYKQYGIVQPEKGSK